MSISNPAGPNNKPVYFILLIVSVISRFQITICLYYLKRNPVISYQLPGKQINMFKTMYAHVQMSYT